MDFGQRQTQVWCCLHRQGFLILLYFPGPHKWGWQCGPHRERFGRLRGEGSRHSISRCFRNAFCPWSSKVTTALLVMLNAAPCGFLCSVQIRISEGSCVSEGPCAALAVSDSFEYIRALTLLPASYSLDHSFNRDREELLLLTYLWVKLGLMCQEIAWK